MDVELRVEIHSIRHHARRHDLLFCRDAELAQIVDIALRELGDSRSTLCRIVENRDRAVVQLLYRLAVDVEFEGRIVLFEKLRLYVV